MRTELCVVRSLEAKRMCFLLWARARGWPSSMDELSYIGIPQIAASQRPFGITQADRARHVYIIGKTGSGKSTLLRLLAIQDIQAGRGLCFIDPHGGEAEALIDFIPKNRGRDFVYFNPADLQYPVALNLLERVPRDERPLVASEVVSIFRSLWDDSWGPRLEYILYNCIAALLDYRNGATLLGVPRMLADDAYRRRIVGAIEDPKVRSFWLDEFASYDERFRVQAVAPIQNKVGQLLSAPVTRNILGQVKSTIRPRFLMDNRKIIIARLPVGLLGESVCNLLGSVLVSSFQLAALARASRPAADFPEFQLFVDEMQRFTTRSFTSILSEARKGRLSLTLAHQYTEQIRNDVLAAVLGNVGTLIAFRIGAHDAQVLSPEFAPRTASSLQELAVGETCIRLMRHGELMDPFVARTLLLDLEPEAQSRLLIDYSRTRFGRRRQDVAGRISRMGSRSGSISQSAG